MTDQPKAQALSAAEAAAAAAAEQEQAGSTGYRVELPVFEGPLDLLLHLIQQHELDIMNIPIAFVTEKYLEFLMLMAELNIDVASEYLVMAATLAHIKSKMLLPTPPEDQDDEAESDLDPRTELVRRLLEYQKYKLAGEELSQRHILGRDIFTRGAPTPMVEGPAPLAPVSLFKLLDAFQGVLARAKTTIDHQIDFDRISITDRINALSDLLRRMPRLRFEQLFEEQQSRAELIVTFLALLEMTRLRMTRLAQDGPLEPIFIELAVADDEPMQQSTEPSSEPTGKWSSAEPESAVDAEPAVRTALADPEAEADPERAVDIDLE
jgi:segregation and condensation protein A